MIQAFSRTLKVLPNAATILFPSHAVTPKTLAFNCEGAPHRAPSEPLS